MQSTCLCLVVVVLWGGALSEAARRPEGDVPPPARHHGYHKMMKLAMSNMMHGVLRDLDDWNPNDKQNIWELSGLFEGDIITDESRNALRGTSTKWPGGVVPYHISDDFDEEEVSVIKGAMDEFHENSCIKFTPYKSGDADWLSIQGDSPGCWSYVGRRGGGQVVNLGRRCVQHGVAAHEILHALGFHHQQSASDRDKYVKIHWKNIRSGTERNFKKYGAGSVTDLGVGYDYDSVMHYSSHAFSKNGKETITPKEDGASIGQRFRMSEKDLQKLKILYGCAEEERNNNYKTPPEFDFWNFRFR